MPQSGNLYNILGLPNYASVDDVRATFRRLAVLYHPDKNPNNTEAEERFKQISAAYNVLGDENKKREYDMRLTGVFTFVPEETPEEKLRKRREKVAQMRRQMKEREEREIKKVYETAKQKMPYTWRYTITAITSFFALFIILSNWYLYDYIGERETAFFKMFLGYIISLSSLMYFLSSLFKKWNAENIDRPFKFDIRNRITVFFILYIVLIFNFSFNVPSLYKKVHLATFGETTQALLSNGYGTDYILSYNIDGVSYQKVIKTQNLYFVKVYAKIDIKYSSLSPHIVEMLGISKVEDL